MVADALNGRQRMASRTGPAWEAIRDHVLRPYGYRWMSIWSFSQYSIVFLPPDTAQFLATNLSCLALLEKHGMVMEVEVRSFTSKLYLYPKEGRCTTT